MGGVQERVDEWEKELTARPSQDGFEWASEKSDQWRFIFLKPEDLSPEQQKILKKNIAMHRVLADSMRYPIPFKQTNFVFTFGAPFDALGEKYNADMLLFITGMDLRETSGAKAVNMTMTLATAILSGGHYYANFSKSVYFLGYSLVDPKTGAVIWFYGDSPLAASGVGDKPFGKRFFRNSAKNILKAMSFYKKPGSRK